MRIVSVVGDGAVLHAFKGLADHEQRDKEALTWDTGLSKVIFDLDFQARGVKDAVDEVFKPTSVDVVEVIGILAAAIVLV